MVTRLNRLGQSFPRCCFFLVVVLVCASTPALRAQTANEKIVFSIPSRSIAAIDLYIAAKIFDFSLQREVNQELGIK